MPRFTLSPRGLLACLITACLTQSVIAADAPANARPSGFMEHVMSENVYAGNGMSRRAQYPFGSLLPRGEKGQVDSGMGKSHRSAVGEEPLPAAIARWWNAAVASSA